MRNKTIKQILNAIQFNHLGKDTKHYNLVLRRGLKLLPTLTEDHVVTLDPYNRDWRMRHPRLTRPTQKRVTIMPELVGDYDGKTFALEYKSAHSTRTIMCSVKFLEHNTEPSADLFEVTLDGRVDRVFRRTNILSVIL